MLDDIKPFPTIGSLFRHISIFKSFESVTDNIIKYDLKPNDRDEQGKTLLFHLISNSYYHIIMAYIFKFNPDISITDKNGETVFFQLHCLLYNSSCDRPDRPPPQHPYHSPAELVRMVNYLLSLDKDGVIILKRNNDGISANKNLFLYVQFVKKQIDHKPWNKTRLNQIMNNTACIVIPLLRHLNHKCTLFNIMFSAINDYDK